MKKSIVVITIIPCIPFLRLKFMNGEDGEVYHKEKGEYLSAMGWVGLRLRQRQVEEKIPKGEVIYGAGALPNPPKNLYAFSI